MKSIREAAQAPHNSGARRKLASGPLHMTNTHSQSRRGHRVQRTCLLPVAQVPGRRMSGGQVRLTEEQETCHVRQEHSLRAKGTSDKGNQGGGCNQWQAQRNDKARDLPLLFAGSRSHSIDAAAPVQPSCRCDPCSPWSYLDLETRHVLLLESANRPILRRYTEDQPSTHLAVRHLSMSITSIADGSEPRGR